MKNVKKGHSRPIVCIDAGHYGKYNRSPVVPAYYESEMNWKLAHLLDAELTRYGIEVWHTRKDLNKDMALEDRGKASSGADLFLSLHSNAAGDESAKYVLGIYQVDDNCGEMDEQSKAFAGILAKAVGGVMGLPYKTWTSASSQDRDGNGYKDDYYGVLRGAHTVHTPGVIIEHGFHTNTATAKWLLEESNLKKLAVAEAAAIAEWFDVKATEKPTEPDHIYRVRKTWEDAASQIGAYRDLNNAKAACKSGYTVFDWNGVPVYGALFYSLEQFVRDVQKACGAKVDGIAGAETLSKTITLSRHKNRTHAAVKPVQKRLMALGYTMAGAAHGVADTKFEAAVIEFQDDNKCWVDGEITAKNKTWRKLLGME